LARDQFGKHYGLSQQPPKYKARVEIDHPPGIIFAIADVPFFMPGRETPSIPAGPAVFVGLLEAKQLPEFTVFRHGTSNCHGIVSAIYHDLNDAGCAHLFAFKRGSSGLIKNEHDPEGLHSWIEIKGWTIDASNGTSNPVIIMPTNSYCGMMQITD